MESPETKNNQRDSPDHKKAKKSKQKKRQLPNIPQSHPNLESLFIIPNEMEYKQLPKRTRGYKDGLLQRVCVCVCVCVLCRHPFLQYMCACLVWLLLLLVDIAQITNNEGFPDGKKFAYEDIEGLISEGALSLYDGPITPDMVCLIFCALTLIILLNFYLFYVCLDCLYVIVALL